MILCGFIYTAFWKMCKSFSRLSAIDIPLPLGGIEGKIYFGKIKWLGNNLIKF